MIEKNKFKPNNEFEKCAPSKNFDKDNNTCFSLEQLIKIASSYNKILSNKNNKINLDIKYTDLNSFKKYLLKELIDKLPDTCKSQECLLKEKFVVDLNDFDLLYNTLRPLGPKKKTKWLSSSDINQIMVQYTFKYPEYRFFGALPIDFELIEIPIDYKTNKFFKTLCNMYNTNLYRFGFVLNLDKHNQSGSHWVALYSDLKNKQIYFFDSYGYKPKKEIVKLMSMIAYWIHINNDNNNKCSIATFTNNDILNFTKGKCNKFKDIDIQYNTIRHQFKNSECGVYSVNFILRLLNGHHFDDITQNITLDDNINICRETYFRFDLESSDSK
jgi:hypothetical protein